MARKPHLFDRLSEPERLDAMHVTCLLAFGRQRGEAVWQSLAPSLTWKGRQLGDAIEPKENFWKGVWRIYEAD